MSISHSYLNPTFLSVYPAPSSFFALLKALLLRIEFKIECVLPYPGSASETVHEFSRKFLKCQKCQKWPK